MSLTSREWHLIARPTGEPAATDFALVVAQVPDPEPGQVLVRNDWMSVDPYMRGRMDDTESYIPPFRLGEPMDGGAVGTVIASRAESMPEGTVVRHFAGWREYAVLPSADVERLDTELAPPQTYLGVLGSTGLTAYVGLMEIARMKPGDVVFVSGAAGAVGSAAGQIARLLGAERVVGSTGGPEKAARLVESYGFDAAIDYRRGGLPAQLAEAAPHGIDVYFDNVGGDHLQAAIGAMNRYGRIALCGAISQYNASEPTPGPDNLALAIGKRLTLRGMIIGDHLDMGPLYVRQAAGWLRNGSLRADETVVDGIGSAVDAFQSLMRGGNMGKMLVHLTGR
ncbi:MAG: NADP-dependent oxidoreductase [Streptomycetaceae bacterium]|nr:NADP-dependent oxidoreductase [Streptomycetaceae bacterium]